MGSLSVTFELLIYPQNYPITQKSTGDTLFHSVDSLRAAQTLSLDHLDSHY